MKNHNIKQVIAGMLTENTGRHMPDSGGAYGRNWQRNQYKNFDQAPEATMEVYTNADDKPDEVVVTFDVYHYLINHLELNAETARLQELFDKHAKIRSDANWLEIMESFPGWLACYPDRDTGVTNVGTTNNYNYDNILSQTLQYTRFELSGGFGVGDRYIMLQIHGGCDARAGYTAPRIFRVLDPDYFLIAQRDITLRCTGQKRVLDGNLFDDPKPVEQKKIPCDNNWWSDDGGYSWYYNGCLSDEKPLFDHCHITEDEPDVLRCPECNGVIEPIVMAQF